MMGGYKMISTAKAPDLDDILMFLDLRADFLNDARLFKDYALERPTKLPLGACKQVNYKGSYWAEQQYSFIPDWS